MSSGFRLFDAAGNISLDISDRIQRVIQIDTINVPANTATTYTMPISGSPSDGPSGVFMSDALTAMLAITDTYYQVGSTSSTLPYTITILVCRL